MAITFAGAASILLTVTLQITIGVLEFAYSNLLNLACLITYRRSKVSGHFLNVPTVYKIGTRWIGAIPRPLAYALSRGIAFVSYMAYRRAVDNVKGNLMKALPSRSAKDISALTLRLFMNYSKYLVDYGRLTGQSRDNVIDAIISYEGKENLDAARAMNRGIILLTAHLGNWELGGIFFGSYGLRTNVVTMQDSNIQIDEVRRSYRERHNVNTITIGESPFSTIEMLNALNNGEVVAMLIDRYREGLDFIEADFFGQTSRFPKGPFTLSRLTGAAIIVAFVVKDGNGYRGIIESPMVVNEENDEADVLKKVIRILERNIVKYPDQWYNFTPIEIGGK